MADQEKSQNFATGFFAEMPPWARAVVFGLCAIPVAVAISGMILNVNVGSYLDKYMDIQLARQEQATDAAADKIIAAFNDRIDTVETRLETVVNEAAASDDRLSAKIEQVTTSIATFGVDLSNITGRVEAIEIWACQHTRVQSLGDDAANFCGQ